MAMLLVTNCHKGQMLDVSFGTSSTRCLQRKQYLHHYRSFCSTLEITSLQFYYQFLENFLQCVLVLLTLPSAPLRSRYSSLKKPTLPFFFILNQWSLILADHILLDVWPSIGTWSTQQETRLQQNLTLFLYQQLSVANSSSAREGTSFLSPRFMLRF